jgi:hypothetical protein
VDLRARASTRSRERAASGACWMERRSRTLGVGVPAAVRLEAGAEVEGDGASLACTGAYYVVHEEGTACRSSCRRARAAATARTSWRPCRTSDAPMHRLCTGQLAGNLRARHTMVGSGQPEVGSVGARQNVYRRVRVRVQRRFAIGPESLWLGPPHPAPGTLDDLRFNPKWVEMSS